MFSQQVPLITTADPSAVVVAAVAVAVAAAVAVPRPQPHQGARTARGHLWGRTPWHQAASAAACPWAAA